MKKTVIIMLIAALLCALFTASCKKPDDDIIIDVDPANTDAVSPTKAPESDEPITDFPLDTDKPDQTPQNSTPSPAPSDAAASDAPTQVPFVSPSALTDAPAVITPTPAQTAYDPTPTPIVTAPPSPSATPADSPSGQLDYSVFDNCCFIGNSVFEGLHNYGVIKNGTWYTKVGLNILTVYDTPVIGGSVPIIDELYNGSYSGILIMFGQNECGWPDLNNFIRKYEQLLQDVWARQPQAKLFMMGITPVSKTVSDEGKNGVTNANINTINAGLEALAARTANAYYVSVPASLYDANGALIADAASDGIHLTKAYMQIWADHICGVVGGILG